MADAPPAGKPRRERPPPKKKKKLASTKNQLRSVERLLSKARARARERCARVLPVPAARPLRARDALLLCAAAGRAAQRRWRPL
jgi:hypothetical protein